jgi:hypothetical protein
MIDVGVHSAKVTYPLRASFIRSCTSDCFGRCGQTMRLKSGLRARKRQYETQAMLEDLLWCYGKTPMQTFIDTQGEIDAGCVMPTASFDRTAHPRLTKPVRASPNFYT